MPSPKFEIVPPTSARSAADEARTGAEAERVDLACPVATDPLVDAAAVMTDATRNIGVPKGWTDQPSHEAQTRTMAPFKCELPPDGPNGTERNVLISTGCAQEICEILDFVNTLLNHVHFYSRSLLLSITARMERRCGIRPARSDGPGKARPPHPRRKRPRRFR